LLPETIKSHEQEQEEATASACAVKNSSTHLLDLALQMPDTERKSQAVISLLEPAITIHVSPKV